MISGSTICALGDAAAMPVESFINHYRHEFLSYIKKENKVENSNAKSNLYNNKEFVLHKK
jgi:NADH-quinone oxidoreductase subunit F